MKMSRLLIKTSLLSAVVGFTLATVPARAAVYVSDAIEGKTPGSFLNGAGVSVGLPATTASWQAINNTAVSTSTLMSAGAGSELGGEGANAQTFHIVQTDSALGSTAIRARFTADTVLSKDDVALGDSVVFAFSVKWNSIPDLATSGMNISLRSTVTNKLVSLVRFIPGAFTLVSGDQSLFSSGTPIETGKWYQFVQSIDLNAGTYSTAVTVLNADGTVFATGVNSGAQTLFASQTAFNRIQFDIDSRTADLEINDISVTYTPVPEPATLGFLGLGSLLITSRKRPA